jgi:hypothetical protein
VSPSNDVYWSIVANANVYRRLFLRRRPTCPQHRGKSYSQNFEEFPQSSAAALMRGSFIMAPEHKRGHRYTVGGSDRSTSDQDVAGQRLGIEQAGAIKVLSDVMSGRSMVCFGAEHWL